MARRGRERAWRGPWGMPTGARAALFLAAALWACGGIQNPDVATGSVQGRIAGGIAGAQAYVLGHPEIATAIAADGTFRLDGVPAGTQYLVLYDGNLGAELVEVEVESADLASVSPIDRPLALAGTILAGNSPLGGVRSTGLAFGVDGTVLQDLQAAPSATLFPLPAGKFSLRARQPGFKETVALVEVTSGQSVPVELQLEVDDGSDARGCLSSSCEDGLSCNPADGRCYLCVTDVDCPGGTCTADHVCKSTAGAGGFCDACASGADCSGGSCATTNEHGDTTPGYCTATCTPSCPAGTKCVSGTCQVELSCLAYATTFGATCLKGDACAAAIEGGTCYRPASVPSTALGTCTASCQSTLECPAGFKCDAAGGSFCRKTCTSSAGCPQGLSCGVDGYCG